jgi:hypothetical protein
VFLLDGGDAIAEHPSRTVLCRIVQYLRQVPSETLEFGCRSIGTSWERSLVSPVGIDESKAYFGGIGLFDEWFETHSLYDLALKSGHILSMGDSAFSISIGDLGDTKLDALTQGSPEGWR